MSPIDIRNPIRMKYARNAKKRVAPPKLGFEAPREETPMHLRLEAINHPVGGTKMVARLKETSDSLVTSILGVHYSDFGCIQNDLVHRYGVPYSNLLF